MTYLTESRDALAAALETILARVRCEAVHRQINGGRCVNCISWAKTIGVPAHLARLEAAVIDASTLADDEAAEAAFWREQEAGNTKRDRGGYYHDGFIDGYRALAAALTERSQR